MIQNEKMIQEKQMKLVAKMVAAAFLVLLSVQAFAFSRPSDVLDAETADSAEKTEGVTARVGVLSGPSGIPMAYRMENDAESTAVSYEVFAGANLLLPKLINGEIDIGFLPPNVAAKVYNANNGAILMAAVAGNGMMSLVTKDKNVHSIADIAGKKVSVAGQGATPDYMMRYLLSANKVEAELDFSIPNAQIAPALIAGKIEYAVVPEPFATVAAMKDKDIVRAVDIQSAFALASGTDGVFPMTVIVVRKEFAEANPEAVRSFLAMYKEAADWTLSNPSAAGELVESHGLGLTSAITEVAIPNAAYTFKGAKEAKADVEKILSVFLNLDASSIGGTLPDDAFYFE